MQTHQLFTQFCKFSHECARDSVEIDLFSFCSEHKQTWTWMLFNWGNYLAGCLANQKRFWQEISPIFYSSAAESEKAGLPFLACCVPAWVATGNLQCLIAPKCSECPLRDGDWTNLQQSFLYLDLTSMVFCLIPQGRGIFSQHVCCTRSLLQYTNTSSST